MDPRLGGVTGGIPWTRMEINEQTVRVPHQARQFVVLYGPDVLLDGKPANVVVRTHNLEPAPPDEVRNWLGTYLQLEPALREAIEREEAWTAHAIQLLGGVAAAEAAGQPQTLFERRALENRTRPGWNERRAVRALTTTAESRESTSARRRRAKQLRVKYPRPNPNPNPESD